MSAASPARQELSALVKLALPLAGAQFGQMLLGAVDTAVIGRLGEAELGAAGLGNSVFFTIATVGLGVMLGLDPLIAQAVGADESQRARRLLWQGSWLAIAISLPLCLITHFVSVSLELLGIGPAAAAAAEDYLAPRIPSLLPFLLMAAARSYLQANDIARPIVLAAVVANLVNLPLSWLLVFGDAALGVPALGVAGAGWTSTVCTVLQVGVLVLAVRAVRAPRPSRRPRLDEQRTIVRLGLPIGLALLAEVSVFGLVNVLAGNLSTRALAAHQVAITLAAATFMVPLGIGSAASVRVGRAVGRGDGPGSRRAGLLAFGLGGGFMSCSALVFLAAPRALAGIITDQPEVIDAAVALIRVAAVFQVCDGLQAVGSGALRGAGDTRWPLVAQLFGHYALGVPLGAWLAFRASLGAAGLWWGLCAGLTGAAVILIVRFAILTARPIARV